MGLGDTRILRRDLANQAWSVEILLTVSDESDKINTQDWSWNITVDTVVKGRDRESLLMTTLGQLKFEGSV